MRPFVIKKYLAVYSSYRSRLYRDRGPYFPHKVMAKIYHHQFKIKFKFDDSNNLTQLSGRYDKIGQDEISLIIDNYKVSNNLRL